MALISKEDLKVELNIKDPDQDSLLTVMAAMVSSVFEVLTGRILESVARTEYYDIERFCKTVVLRNRPVLASPAPILYDDPDWDWTADTIVTATSYRVDYEKGIVYLATGFFSEGPQALKAVYTAGYSSATFPVAAKEIFVRQACHWYKQARDQNWDKASVSLPEGAGTTSFSILRNNLLPEFMMLVEGGLV